MLQLNNIQQRFMVFLFLSFTFLGNFGVPLGCLPSLLQGACGSSNKHPFLAQQYLEEKRKGSYLFRCFLLRTRNTSWRPFQTFSYIFLVQTITYSTPRLIKQN